ncbi:MAG: phosphatidate cytidylyltransferase [Pseudorhodoplanes sp.]|jgi:phosphatidate cytidylyltransferase|nr:phosphatidate cytidylyltransferase [Pseudorhodoplanes sp.]
MMVSDPATVSGQNTSVPSNRNLLLRVLSASVLAPLAIAVAYWGDWPFAVFWAIAALAVWWEWVRLIDPRGSQGALALGACALILEALLTASDRVDKAPIIILLALFGIAVTATKHAKWIAGGIVYASALLIAPLVIRADPAFGFQAILFLFAIVWSTDIGGYFGGRALGGPKLSPAISPKKTWSGAIVGTAVAVGAALAIGRWQGSPIIPIALVAILLSIASQAGDLFESAFKRRFDAKDASGLIPGHGGVMDRLDGFIFAGLVAAIFGVLRGGLENAGGGLIAW